MKKTIFLSILLILSCLSAFAQKPAPTVIRPPSDQKLSVVVGAVGEDPKPGLRKTLETQIKIALVRDGRFIAVTREEAVLDMVDNEQAYQRSGAVDDSQIRQIGAQSGARYVCVVEIAPMMDAYMLSAQFIDIESAKIVATAGVPSALKNYGDFLAASDALIEKFLGYPPKRGGKSGYGKGVFVDAAQKASPLAVELMEVLKQRTTIYDGTCIEGVTVAIEGDTQPACGGGMVGLVCRADVRLVITSCKGGGKTILKGSIVGSYKNTIENARRQFERNIETAKFWDEWANELEKRVK